MYKIITILVLALINCFLLTGTVSAASISSYLCQNKNYVCFKVKAHQSWESLFTNKSERDTVMRINRLNIPLHPGQKIAIPRGNIADFMSYSPFPAQISPPGGKLIFVSINPGILAWGAYNEHGSLVKWGPASGGKGYCPDIGRACHTKTGKFTIYRKEGNRCVSSRFPVSTGGGAPMPYCMFFHGGFALHGSYQVPGYNASHGCIRIYVPDAKWLNEEFVRDAKNVRVIVSHQSL